MLLLRQPFCSFTYACISSVVLTTTMTSGSVCPKCATTKKSGQSSCCARGGAWFNNCGGVTNANVDHTWTEGIRACKDFASLFSSKTQSEVMLHHEPSQEQPKATSERNGPRLKIIDPATASVSDAGTTNCEGCCALSKITFFISILCIVLRIQM